MEQLRQFADRRKAWALDDLEDTKRDRFEWNFNEVDPYIGMCGDPV